MFPKKENGHKSPIHGNHSGKFIAGLSTERLAPAGGKCQSVHPFDVLDAAGGKQAMVCQERHLQGKQDWMFGSECRDQMRCNCNLMMS
jgi:hypothetical protein